MVSKSVENVALALDVMAERAHGISAAEMTAATGLHRLAAARLLEAMVQGGLARRDGATNRYRVTPKLYRWGCQSLVDFLPQTAVRGEVAKLVARTQRIAYYYVLDGDRVISVEQTEWLGDFAATVSTGYSAPWYELMTGKMLVAFSPEPVKQSLLQEAGHALKQVPTAQELDATREKGFSMGVGATGRRGIAAPILDNDSHAIAALLLILSPSDRETEYDALTMELRDSAERCSARLGFTTAHALI